MDNLAEESESFPNGFSTITLDHPEGDMHVFLIAVVTDSNTDGGKAEEKKKIISRDSGSISVPPQLCSSTYLDKIVDCRLWKFSVLS